MTRLAAAMGLALGLLLASVPGWAASAQVPDLADAQPTFSFVYGGSLTFGLKASAAAVLTAARLTVQVDRHNASYSTVVPLSRGRTISAAHSVSAQELDLPPIAQLSYVWELQDETGQVYSVPAQEVWYEDNSVPWTWVVVAHDGIFVHTDGQDATISAAVLEIAHSARAQVNHTLGTTYGSRPDEELHIYVYPELASLAASLRLHGRRVQDWIAAYAILDQRTALVAAPAGPDVLVNLQRDVPHEVAHIVTGAEAGLHGGDLPGWFSEGIALMTAGEPDLTLRDLLAEEVEQGRALPLEPLCASSFSSMPPREAALAYAQSESVMRYITARYGTAAVRGLLDGYAGGLTCGSAVESALGISLTQLESQWHNDLAGNLARAPRQDFSLVPWIVVWAASILLALLFVAPQPDRGQASGYRDSETPYTSPTVSK